MLILFDCQDLESISFTVVSLELRAKVRFTSAVVHQRFLDWKLYIRASTNRGRQVILCLS